MKRARTVRWALLGIGSLAMAIWFISPFSILTTIYTLLLLVLAYYCYCSLFDEET